MSFKDFYSEFVIESYEGEQTSVHPVIKVGVGHEDYMKWAFKIDNKFEDNAATIHMKNVSMVLNHNAIDKTIRNTDMSKTRAGSKQPIILLKGEIVAVDFDESELRSKLQERSWEPVTYNPHKNPEVVLSNTLPSWWCADPRLGDNRGKPDFIKNRLDAMVEYGGHPDQPTQVTHKDGSGRSIFTAREVLLKQHRVCNEDYMWMLK